MTIFTIGYARLRPRRLAEIATGLDATVIDCRVKPVSRIPGFGGRQLAQLLGARYEQRGDRLGGRGFTTAAGIAELRAERAEGRTVVLLCMEEHPKDCHRHLTICGPHFPEAVHIFRNELLTAAGLQAAIDADSDYPIVGSLKARLGETLL
jgi:hypothetical protein